ncbi:hypothetical protein TrLO_g10689 [Triparma laevis f. longispina]|uniref:NAD(P)-binding protein n=1 Tax=Triparma laevis f. longispina TaxID=1714387 RepID=A0A9W7FF10_9STRA|nr:hypothetical protein TrLO_g10689 [Triparma laevis f. longispina]
MSKIALVVGATSGIGHGIAVTLASKGTSVILAGRSETAAAKIIEECKLASKDVDPQPTFTFKKVDGFNLTTIKDLAGSITSLDWLIMTQGMATIQGFTPTSDGFDQKLSLHVYSRFLLASLLSPKLAQSSDGRVLSVLSGGVHSPYTSYTSDFELKNNYSVKNAADSAGFYNDCYLDCLASKNNTVKYGHAAPGFVSTNWGTEMPAMLRMMIRPLQAAFGRDKFKCGEYMYEGLMGMETGRVNIIDQKGMGGGGVTKVHEEAKGEVFEKLGELCKQWM